MRARRPFRGVEPLELRVVPSAFTVTSPTRFGLLPANVTPIGGIVVDLVGLNGRRIVSQIPAGGLFRGTFRSGIPEDFRGNPGTVGIQPGWTPALLDLTGGGLSEVALRITLFDGDSADGDFDHLENTLLVNGVDFGDFSAVGTEENTSDGQTTLSANPDGGFRNNKLDTGFFHLDDPARLSALFTGLRDSGNLTVQLADADPYDNNLDFTAGLDGGLIDAGTPPAPPNLPPVLDSLSTDGPVPVGSPATITAVGSDPDGGGAPLSYAFDLDGDGAFELTNATGLASASFPSAGDYPIRVRVTDAAGDSAEGSIVQVVQAAAPQVSPGAEGASREGDLLQVDLGSFADLSAGTSWTVSVDWGDGSPAETFAASRPGALGSLPHRFRQDGEYRVRVRVAAESGLFGEAHTSVIVANLAPAITPPADQTARIGTTTRIVLGSFADPGPDGPWLGEVDWGDGSPRHRFTIGSQGTLGRVAHAFARYGDFTVTVSVSDPRDTGRQSFVVRVENLAPVIDSFLVTSPVAAGSPAAIAVIASDPDGGGVPLSYGFDLDGDGTFELASATGLASFLSRTPGTYPIRVRVADAEGGSTEAAASVVVVAAPPVLTPGVGESSREGDLLQVDLGTFADPTAGRSWTVSVDWGDGSPAETFAVAQAGPLGSRPHRFRQDGEYQVRVRVAGESGLFDEALTAVGVANVAPVVDPAGFQTVTRGVTKRFALGSFADPGLDAPWAASIDWGDGSPVETFSVGSAGDLGTRAHAFARHGQFAVKIRVDDGQATTLRAFSVRVANLAPVIDAIEVTSPVGAGELASVRVLARDPDGNGSPLQFLIDLGDGKPGGGLNATGLASSAFSTPGVHPVTVRVFDDQGGQAEGSATILVVAVPPVLEADPSAEEQAAVQGEVADILLGRFSAATAGTLWTIEVDWGDGSPLEIFTRNSPGDLGSRPHVFATAGRREVRVYVADERGLGDGQTLSVLVLAATPRTPVVPPTVTPVGPVPRPVPAPGPVIVVEVPRIRRPPLFASVPVVGFDGLFTPSGAFRIARPGSRFSPTSGLSGVGFPKDSDLGTRIELPGLGSLAPTASMNLPAPMPPPEEPAAPTDETEPEAATANASPKPTEGARGDGAPAGESQAPVLVTASAPAASAEVSPTSATQNGAAEAVTLVSSVTPDEKPAPVKRGAFGATITMLAAIHCRKQWGRTRKLNPNQSRKRWR